MPEIVGEELGTPDVTDFIGSFDPRYEWLADILDQYLTYVGGPEYTGQTDEREYMPEEVQEIRDILAALEAGDEIDIESIKNDYPLLGDYISATYPDLTVDTPTVTDQGSEGQDSGIDISGAIDSLLDKFPTWEDLWSEVQSQLPSNPQEWGDVIRSVIEATGIDLPDSDIYGILNGGYGVTWNPGGIAGLPSGVGAIIQSGLIFVPGIPVGLPPSSTIIRSIGDFINAENPIDVLIERAQEVFGDIVNNPSDLINTIITDELDLPENIWDILIGGAAVTQEVLDWLSENGFSSEGEYTTVPPLGGDDEEDGEEEAIDLSGDDLFPDTTADDVTLIVDPIREITDDKTITDYNTIVEPEPEIPVLIDDSLLGSSGDTGDDSTTLIVDPIREITDDKTITNYNTINEPEPEPPILIDDSEMANFGDLGDDNTTDVGGNYEIVDDTIVLTGDETLTTDPSGSGLNEPDITVDEPLDELTTDAGGGGGGSGFGSDFTPFYSGINYQVPMLSQIVQNPNVDYTSELNRIINQNSGMFS